MTEYMKRLKEALYRLRVHKLKVACYFEPWSFVRSFALEMLEGRGFCGTVELQYLFEIQLSI